MLWVLSVVEQDETLVSLRTVIVPPRVRSSNDDPTTLTSSAKSHHYILNISLPSDKLQGIFQSYITSGLRTPIRARAIVRVFQSNSTICPLYPLRVRTIIRMGTAGSQTNYTWPPTIRFTQPTTIWHVT